MTFSFVSVWPLDRHMTHLFCSNLDNIAIFGVLELVCTAYFSFEMIFFFNFILALGALFNSGIRRIAHLFNTFGSCLGPHNQHRLQVIAQQDKAVL